MDLNVDKLTVLCRARISFSVGEYVRFKSITKSKSNTGPLPPAHRQEIAPQGVITDVQHGKLSVSFSERWNIALDEYQYVFHDNVAVPLVESPTCLILDQDRYRLR